MLTKVPYLGKRTKALTLLRKTYRNWFEIGVAYLLGRPFPEMLHLRTGMKIRCAKVGGVWTIMRLAMLIEDLWSVEAVEGEILRLSKASLIFRLRFTAADLVQLRDIFDLHIYGTDFSDKVVLDVGMFNGDSALYFAKMGAKFVLGLEPFRGSFELALQNIESNGLLGKVIPLNVALASTRGETRLLVASGNLLANSLQPTHFVASGQHFDSEVAVETTTIEALVKEYGLVRIDFLKMNCEGCEYDVIRNLKPELASITNEIFLQFHDGPKDLPDILTRHGFKVDFSGKLEGFLHARRNL